MKCVRVFLVILKFRKFCNLILENRGIMKLKTFFKWLVWFFASCGSAIVVISGFFFWNFSAQEKEEPINEEISDSDINTDVRVKNV